MRRREGPSVALGAAAVVALAALLVAGRMVWQRLPKPTEPAEARCEAPIAIVDRDGVRLGCASDVPCAARAGDRVRLADGDGATCVVEPRAMSAEMRLLAGLTIDINSASATDLARIDGVSAALAQRIVDVRQQRGRFDSIEALREVPGVGPATMSALRQHVSLE